MLSPPVGSVYRIRVWWRCFAVAYLALGLAFLGSAVTNALSGTKVPTVRDVVVPVVLSLVGLGISAYAFSSVVSFSENSVDVENVFRSRTLPFAGSAADASMSHSGDAAALDTSCWNPEMSVSIRSRSRDRTTRWTSGSGSGSVRFRIWMRPREALVSAWYELGSR
jgi:hypothetical protein